MSRCTCCGSTTTFIEEDVECLRTETYTVNEPGSPRRRNIIGRTDWRIGICRNCTEKRLEESLRSSRRLGLFVGPTLLGGSVLSALILFPMLAHVRSPLVSLAGLLFCGGAFFVGLIMVPVGLYQAIKASFTLRRLRREGDAFQLSDDEKWKAVEREGERIIKCLESTKKEFVGDFILPKGDPRLNGSLSYAIAKRSPSGVRKD